MVRMCGERDFKKSGLEAKREGKVMAGKKTDGKVGNFCCLFSALPGQV